MFLVRGGETGSKYGENIIGKYAEKLINDVGKKYNKRTLFRMRQFYIVFSNEKVSPIGTQLSWSHYRAMLSLKDYDEINYYIQISVNNNLSKSELEQKIKNKSYERLDDKTKEKLITIEEDKTIGIIIYKKDNKFVMEYCSDDRIYRATYILN